MKATGIVRRVDDLGRIVIPKEIRRTLRIREGDPQIQHLHPLISSSVPSWILPGASQENNPNMKQNSRPHYRRRLF